MQQATTRVTVCIENANINQYDMLPPRYTDGAYEITTHHDPKWMIENGVPVFNFDVLITHDRNKWEQLVPANQLVVVPRYDKTHQSIAINSFFRDNRCSQSTAIQAGVFGSSHVNKKHPSFLGSTVSGKVVVKPEDAARGVCQFVVDFDKVSVGPFLGDLHSSMTPEKIAEKYSPHVVFSAGAIKTPKEVAEIRKNSSYTFQRYIPNVETEIRVLTDSFGLPGFSCVRSRVGDEYVQATGVTHLVDNIVCADLESLDIWKGNDYQLFLKLLEDVVGPMQSVDLFITEDGGWGIFEYCNQYGIAGVSAAYYSDSVKEFVMRAIDKSQAAYTALI